MESSTENENSSYDGTEEVAIFIDHDWYAVMSSGAEMVTVAVCMDNKTREVGNISVKNGEIVPKCTNFEDELLESFRDMRVKRLEKRRLCVNLGDLGTIFLAPLVNFNNVHQASILSIDVNCTGKLLVTSATDGSIKLWSSETGELLKNFEVDNMDVNKVRFFPSGLVVLSCGGDLSVKVLSVETGLCHRSFQGHTRGVQDIAIIGVGKDVLSASKDGTVKMWNCGSAACLHDYKINQGGVNAISLNSMESEAFICCTASEEGASMLDLRSADVTNIYTTSRDECTSVCFDNDANHVYIGSEKGLVLLYDLRNRKFAAKMQSYRSDVTHMSTICKNRLLVSYHDGSVCTYDKNLQQRVADVCFSGADCDPVYDFAVFDDTYLYTCCRDRVVRKYEIVV